MTRSPGDIIDGRYRVIDRLGDGGMATTWLARDIGSGLDVALKELRFDRLEEWKAVQLFEREALTLKRLSHPQIPAYVDDFRVETEGRTSLFVAQTIARGRSLEELIGGGWRANEEQARQLADGLLEIQSYLEQLVPPVVHRDIKPGNIILAPDGTASLVDFGAVKDALRDSSEMGSTIVGTFGYMAPEQLIGQAGPRTDLYGIGCSLLFAITGRHPGDLPNERMKIDVRRAISMSDDFCAWLSLMIAPAAEDRFEGARVALDALRTNHFRRSSCGDLAPIPVHGRFDVDEKDGEITIRMPSEKRGPTITLLAILAAWLFAMAVMVGLGAADSLMPAMGVVFAFPLLAGAAYAARRPARALLVRETLRVDRKRYHLDQEVAGLRIRSRGGELGDIVDVTIGRPESHARTLADDVRTWDSTSRRSVILHDRKQLQAIGGGLSRVEQEWLADTARRLTGTTAPPEPQRRRSTWESITEFFRDPAKIEKKIDAFLEKL